jgi:hypothetical protein
VTDQDALDVYVNKRKEVAAKYASKKK